MEALFPLLLIAVFYVLMIRPQQQRVKRQREMTQSLTVGDEIVTVGGIVGRIVTLSDERVGIGVADGVVIEILRGAVGQRLVEESSPEMTDGRDDPGMPGALDDEQQAG